MEIGWVLGVFAATVLAAGIGFTSAWQAAVPAARVTFYILAAIFLYLFAKLVFPG